MVKLRRVGAVFCAVFVIATASQTFAAQGLKTDYQLQRPPANRLTGKEFKAALGSRFSINAARQPANATLRAISDTQRISILLDRRIDRDRKLQRDIVGLSLLTALQQIAEDLDAAASVIGGTVYIGPSDSAKKIQTLIEIQKKRLASLDRKRRAELNRSKLLHWSDLTPPKDVLMKCTTGYGLKLSGQPVPHDLWQWNSLAGLDAFEAITLTLIQFDLTFELSVDGTEIVVQQVPESVSLTRTYRVTSQTTIKQAVETCRQQFGIETTTPTRQGLTFIGSSEQHAQVALIVRGRSQTEKTKTPKSPAGMSTIPLAKRQFNLPAQTVPAVALITSLRESGIDIRIDKQQFKAAGLTLNQRVKLQFDNADIDTVFKLLCDQMHATYTIDGEIITIVPK